MKSLDSVIFKNAKRKDEKIGISIVEQALSAAAFSIVFSFLALIMLGSSVYVTRKLEEIDQTYAFVNILLLVNFLILFAKSIFEGVNVLYFSKDLKILLRMPIKPISILSAKLKNMIISEYSMEIIMLAIPMAVYGVYTKVGALFYIYMVGILLVLPIIPIMITSFIISIIMRFTNLIKNKSKVMYLTIIISIFFVAIVTTLFSNNRDISVSKFEDVILNANGLAESIANYFVLIKPIMGVLLNYNNTTGFLNFALYILESFICYFAILKIMSKIYLKGAIGTTINSRQEKNKVKELKISDFKKKSVKKAYISKELKTMIRTPIFCIQCIVMPIVYPFITFLLMAAFINFANQIGIDALSSFYERISQTWGLAVFLGIGQVFYMMNFSSIIAISRESKNAILMKYLPIGLYKQFNLKMRIGILTNMISSILVTIAYYTVIKNILYSLGVFVILIFVNLIGEKFKLLIDLKRPQTNWDSEYTMMKQNTNVMYELFYTLIMICILVLISMILNKFEVYLLFILMTMIIINMFINEYVNRNQNKIFKEIF